MFKVLLKLQYFVSTFIYIVVFIFDVDKNTHVVTSEYRKTVQGIKIMATPELLFFPLPLTPSHIWIPPQKPNIYMSVGTDQMCIKSQFAFINLTFNTVHTYLWQ